MVTAGPTASLPQETRAWLLGQARSSLVQHFATRGAHTPSHIPRGAEAPRGCFVSIHDAQGHLRGCVGTLEARHPLWEAVSRLALAAAINDPRFLPLEPDELGHSTLEISALGRAVPATLQDIQVGVHGIWVQQSGRRGVLLPHVAVHHGWDAETFLRQTCRKAGLEPDAWRRPGLSIEVFSAEVFAEATP